MEKDVFVHAREKNMSTLKGKVKWFNELFNELLK